MASATDLKDEPDCLDHCFSRIHGQEVCAIASAATGINALPLWVNKCSNYAHVRDDHGRTALHIVASTGNIEALEWLIKRAGAEIDKKDTISGYTALHRSIFFGQIHIARSLLNFNADTNLKDSEGMTAFDMCNADRPVTFSCNLKSDPTELFVWGTNDNYTLGSTIQQARLVPEQLEIFKRNNVSIMKVIMQPYHSVFLTQDKNIYVSGNGRGGRLGTGFESTVLQPELLHFSSGLKCIEIAAGVDHTLFLMENGRVLSCGSNEYGVLGQKQSSRFSLVPKSVDLSAKQTIKGIAAARYHSVFYTSRNIFSCGANRGQLGHPPEKGALVYEPKLISQLTLSPDGETKFTHVCVNTFATVIRVSVGMVYVLHKFECNKINAKNFDVVKLQVNGGGFDDSQLSEKPFKDTINPNEDALVIAMLTSSGKIIIWRAEKNQPLSSGTCSRAVFHCGRILDISDISLSQTCLAFVTTSGEAFKSVWKPNSKPVYMDNWQIRHAHDSQLSQNNFQVSSGGRRPQKGKEELSSSKILLEFVKIQKIKNVYSALNITCDTAGKNFGIIQASLKIDLTYLPDIAPPKLAKDMSQFYNETNEHDGLHDVVFKVEKQQFPAHFFIIASNCPKLYQQVQKESKQANKGDDHPLKVTIENTHPRAFEQILQFIYTGSCDFTTIGRQIVNTNNEDFIKLTIDAAKKHELTALCKQLHHFEIVDNTIHRKPGGVVNVIVKGFNGEMFDELTDMRLQSKDGEIFKAHRCILVARSEYFHSMLYANSWSEQEKDSMKPIHFPFTSVALKILLEYIYTDKISELPTCDFDRLSEILAMSDHLFMEMLRTMVESALAELLSLKNVATILYIADRCNAVQLKESCMQFICINLAIILENRILDALPLEIVKDLTHYYSQFHPKMCNRVMKRARSAPTDEMFAEAMQNITPQLQSEIENCSVEEEIKKPLVKSTKNKPRLRSRASESEIPESSSNISLDATATISNNHIKLIAETSSQSNTRVPAPANLTAAVGRKCTFPTPSQTMARLRNAEVLEKERTLNPSEFPSLLNLQTSWIPSRKLSSSSACPDRCSSSPSISTNSPSNKSGAVGANNLPILKSPPSNSNKIKPVVSTPSNVGSGKRKTKWKSISNVDNAITPNLPPPELHSGGRDPKNPWKVETTTKLAFQEIVQDEVEKKENLQRAVTKSLHLMQIEDQAINQLTARYNSEDVEEGTELLIVERVCSTNFAPPTWVPNSSFNPNLKQ